MNLKSNIHSAVSQNKKIIIPIILLLALLSYGVYYVVDTYVIGQQLIFSGTIEATEIHLGTERGGLVKEVFVHEGDAVSEGTLLAEIKPVSGGSSEKVYTPIAGVLLTRSIEPGEIAVAGSTLLVVGDLNTLTLTVYVPEDQYGQVKLNQIFPVSVDSYPGQSFSGRVTHIADQAEFTPRNVQTVQGRKNTVYAVRLTLENADQRLKPGMPADVSLEVK